jgi:hypothetical protein
MNLGIEFGACAPPLEDQIKSAGRIINGKDLLEHCQKDADAVTRLLIRGLISQSTGKAARMKILKNIGECVLGD